MRMRTRKRRPFATALVVAALLVMTLSLATCTTDEVTDLFGALVWDQGNWDQKNWQ